MQQKSKTLADILFPERDETDNELLNVPPEQRKLHTETYDFSISTIYDYLTSSRIFIPRFQRKYIWSKGQASRLIESLIIQCPIPVLYFSQTTDEKFSVIDGNQRLNSIKLFIDNGFELTGLTTYPDLNGNTFSSLDPRFQRHILNRTLRCIVILKETHPQIKFDVFERINTGSARLTPQELRHGIYTGPFIDLLDEIAKDKLFLKLTQTSKDTRMKAEELVLRFFALSESLSTYTNPFVTFLNNYCEQNRNIDSIKSKSLKTSFLNILNKINLVLGEYSFKVYDVNLKKIRFNAALFDAQMIGFFKKNPSESCIESINKTEFIKNQQVLFKNEDFYKWITAATTNTNAVKNRISDYIEFIDKECK